jgi:biotin carboxyl carrier protein
MKLELKVEEQKRSLELTQSNDGKWQIVLDGASIPAEIAEIADNTFSIRVGGSVIEARVSLDHQGLKVSCHGRTFRAEVQDPRSWRGRSKGVLEASGRQQLTAPMPGRVVRVLVAVGDQVTAGQGIIVVEAMKMQNEIRSPKNGTVESVLVSEGQAVSAGLALAVIS